MEELEQTLIYLKELLDTIPGVKYVGHGKPTPLNTDNKLPAIYIVPTNEAYVNTKNTKTLCGYDNYVYVKLVVNMECTYDLEWIALRHTIIDAVLKDTDLWKGVVDRDVVATVHDEYDNYPRKAFQIAFEFRLRVTA